LEKVSSWVAARLNYVPGSSDPIDCAVHTLLCRVATGRDAADIDFLDNHKGVITLTKMEVTAVVDDDLPKDSIDQLMSIG
jgi:hypothetical protein